MNVHARITLYFQINVCTSDVIAQVGLSKIIKEEHNMHYYISILRSDFLDIEKDSN